MAMNHPKCIGEASSPCTYLYVVGGSVAQLKKYVIGEKDKKSKQLFKRNHHQHNTIWRHSTHPCPVTVWSSCRPVALASFDIPLGKGNVQAILHTINDVPRQPVEPWRPMRVTWLDTLHRVACHGPIPTNKPGEFMIPPTHHQSNNSGITGNWFGLVLWLERARIAPPQSMVGNDWPSLTTIFPSTVN